MVQEKRMQSPRRQAERSVEGEKAESRHRENVPRRLPRPSTDSIQGVKGTGVPWQPANEGVPERIVEQQK